jgi:hypothetical protein
MHLKLTLYFLFYLHVYVQKVDFITSEWVGILSKFKFKTKSIEYCLHLLYYTQTALQIIHELVNK